MPFRSTWTRIAIGIFGALAVAVPAALARGHHGAAQRTNGPHRPQGARADSASTSTPIKHLVVIFQENVSFDHYFGTYPRARNAGDGPRFRAARGTPSVNGLTGPLLTANPNSANPQRLARSEALTCDQDHDYKAEQQAFDRGLMDKFVESTNNSSCSPPDVAKPNLVMDYFDGNTVTGLWNYAQHFAMSDNSYNTTFGPSTPGALNLVSGQTHGATPSAPTAGVANGTVIGDPDPTTDDCSKGTTAELSGPNVGDLLNARKVTWGWFQGGFRPTATTGGKAVCGASHKNVGGASVTDYSAHHEPFQYYPSTANAHHVAPSSLAAIGHDDRANHQYDLADFDRAVDAGRMPAVSFLKAAKYQDGHAGYSDPLDEQRFIVQTINRLQHTKAWKDTAVIVAYDDSDGWYDHQIGPIVNHSSDPANDALSGPGMCGETAPGAAQDRCGYGPRLPLLAISPWTRPNTVDHSVTDQSSILRFIEDNWRTGRIGNDSFDAKAGSLDHLFSFDGARARKLYLDPSSGQLPGRRSTRPRR